MKSNIWIYEDTQKLLGINQTEFATDYCGKSESYIRVLRTEPDRTMPTEVLINIFEKLDATKSLQQQTMKQAINRLQQKIAEEIIYRNTNKQHLKLREMLIRIVQDIEAKRTYEAPPILIM